MTDLFLHNELVSTLGWTILHSLWQAVLLAGLLWTGSRLTASSVIRYRLAYATLMAQLLVSVLTFGWLFEPAAGGTTETIALVNFTPYAAVATESSWWQPGVLLSWVVVFWLVGLVIGTTRLAFSLGRVRGMQREAQRAVPDNFRQLVNRLAARIGYQGPLYLGISERIGSPALIGHLKPMLLFPLAVINQLTPGQVEAVILHELAHLRRQDHWWNLLQCVVEVLFYYHPVVWWIGARIREEREHCCDDLVLRHGPDRLAYAKALLYFEQQSATPATAVALTNNPTGLLGRVKRFLHQQNLPYQMKSRLFLLPLFALITVVGTAVYAPAPADTDFDPAVEFLPAVTDIAPPTSLAPAAAPKVAISTVQPDTLPKGRHQVSTYRNGSSTKVIVEDQAIQKLEIDGRVIPEAEYDQHLPMVEGMLGKSTSGIATITDKMGWGRIERDGDGIEFQLEEFGDKWEEKFETLGEGWEYRLEELGDDWGAFGESMGELGERLGVRIERLFDGNGNSHSYRFDLKEGDEFYYDIDSLPPGSSLEFDTDGDDRSVIIRRNSQRYSLDELLEDVERERGSSSEAEIQEMETMIQRLERRKEQMRRDLERVKADGERAKRDEKRVIRDQQRIKGEAYRMQAEEERDHARSLAGEARSHAQVTAREARDSSPDYEAIIGQLRKEGMIEDDGPIRKMVVDGKKLKVNGKTASLLAHQRFLDLHEAKTGRRIGSNSKVTVTFGEF